MIFFDMNVHTRRITHSFLILNHVSQVYSNLAASLRILQQFCLYLRKSFSPDYSTRRWNISVRELTMKRGQRVYTCFNNDGLCFEMELFLKHMVYDINVIALHELNLVNMFQSFYIRQ